jgi:DNA-binding transcriptional regulator YbjK
MRRRKNATGPIAVKAADDTAKALDLKRSGHTIRQIAATIGRSVGWVHSAIQKYVDQHPYPHLQALRAEVMDRQAAIIASHWATRTNARSAKVIQESDKILIQITGIEAKKEVDVSGSLAVTDGAHDKLLSSLAGLASKLGTSEGDPPPEAN